MLKRGVALLLLLCALLALSACAPSGGGIAATPHSTQPPAN